MAYDQKLAERVRQKLASLPNVAEKPMMGGLTFMYNDKMCLGIIKDELMCRIDPEFHETAIGKPGCRTMDFTNRPMRGYVTVAPSALQTEKDLDYWVGIALEYNKKAKASKKRK